MNIVIWKHFTNFKLFFPLLWTEIESWTPVDIYQVAAVDSSCTTTLFWRYPDRGNQNKIKKAISSMCDQKADTFLRSHSMLYQQDNKEIKLLSMLCEADTSHRLAFSSLKINGVSVTLFCLFLKPLRLSEVLQGEQMYSSPKPHVLNFSFKEFNHLINIIMFIWHLGLVVLYGYDYITSLFHWTKFFKPSLKKKKKKLSFSIL